jgi:endoglucanase
MGYHLDPLTRPVGTDAAAIQISRQGIPAALLGIALRNMHTPLETVSVKDIERVGRLLAAFIARLDDEFLASLAWDLDLDEEAE